MRGPCKILVGKTKERVHLKGLELNWRITLNSHFKKLTGGLEWIDLAQDRERCRSVVNSEMNFRVT